MAMKEKDLQKSILDLLRLKGFVAVKFPSVGIWNKKTGHYIPQPSRGTSDILACSPKGQFWAIECKSAKGEASEEQMLFLHLIKQKGGMAILARNIDDVIRLL